MVENNDGLREEIAHLRKVNGELHRENHELKDRVDTLTAEVQKVRAREETLRAIAVSDKDLDARLKMTGTAHHPDGGANRG